MKQKKAQLWKNSYQTKNRITKMKWIVKSQTKLRTEKCTVPNWDQRWRTISVDAVAGAVVKLRCSLQVFLFLFLFFFSFFSFSFFTFPPSVFKLYTGVILRFIDCRSNFRYMEFVGFYKQIRNKNRCMQRSRDVFFKNELNNLLIQII